MVAKKETTKDGESREITIYPFKIHTPPQKSAARPTGKLHPVSVPYHSNNSWQYSFGCKRSRHSGRKRYWSG